MDPKKNMQGQYIMVGAILGVGVGLLFGNLAACAVVGVGLGFLAGLMQKKN